MAEPDSSKQPRAPKRARAAFNWPPTDQDLAELGIFFPDSEPDPATEPVERNVHTTGRSNAAESSDVEIVAADTAMMPEVQTPEVNRANTRRTDRRQNQKRRKQKATESSPATPFTVSPAESEVGPARRARGDESSRLKPVPPGTGGPFNWPPTDDELAEFTKPFEPLTAEMIVARQQAEALRGPRDIWDDEIESLDETSDAEAPGTGSRPVRPWQKTGEDGRSANLGRLLAAGVVVYALAAVWWRWGVVPQVPASSDRRPAESIEARAPRAPQSTEVPSATPTTPAESPAAVPATPAPAAPVAPAPAAPAAAQPSRENARAVAPPTPTAARARTESPAAARERAPASPVAAPSPAVTEVPAPVEPVVTEVARNVEPIPAAEPVASMPEPEAPAPSVPAAPAPATTTAATVAATTPAPAVPAPASVNDRSAIQRVLARYEYAYDQLDASAAAAVWPSVDARALERAFARLQNQDLEFHDCNVDVQSSGALAHCSGELRYVRRVGSVAPRAEPHTWTILLERYGEDWRIARVTGK